MYLTPVTPSDFGFYPSESKPLFGDQIQTTIPQDVEVKDALVLIGVPEDRNAECNAGCALAPDRIRHYLYRLASPLADSQQPSRVYDLGNIIPGQNPEDTYYALSEVAAGLLAAGNTLVVLGGSQDLTFPLYKAYERLGRIINIASIDPRFDLDPYEEITSRTYLKHIIMQTPNYLFFHSNIGYQSYFVGQNFVQLMDELKFDAYRLGELQADMSRAEALVRNADLLSVDIASVRQSDAPGVGDPSPHGFYGEQLCQMMRYAGMSDKISCLGLFEVNPAVDLGDQTSHMAAQAVWHFIEAFFNRLGDSPRLHPEQCKRFLVSLEEQALDLTFYKSKLSDRWWVEVPCNDAELQELYSRHLLLPCTYADYQQAMTGDIPALWWRYFQRLHTTED